MNTEEYILKNINDIHNLIPNTNFGASFRCLLALKCYIDSNFDQALQNLGEANTLLYAEDDSKVRILYELLVGYVNFNERNNIFTLHYNNAKKIAGKTSNDDYFSILVDSFSKVPSGTQFIAAVKKDPLLALVKIGQAVAAEKNINVLMKTIAEETKEALQADRCTVFLYDDETQELWSKVALGLESTELRFPANQGLAGHVFTTGETINIKDAYSDSRFNKNIDKETGYKTNTILCMPIKNINQEIIGVFQVLNKISAFFTDEDEDLLFTIGSSAGISLENATLFERQNEILKSQKITFDSFISTLAASIDARDKITAGHSTRVRMYSTLIAEKLGLDEKTIEIIQKAAALHDIGKIGIRDSVLQKEGKLTPEEYEHIQEHVVITHNILEKIHMSDDFKLIKEIACSHHEKYDGTGYYRKLKGEEIPFGGRILAVSDVFDAITSKRHYRDKMPIVKVISILIGDSGTHFDKNIVDVFLSISLDKMVEVFLTENHVVLSLEDKEILSHYSMIDLYNFINSGDKSDLVDKFNHYYTGNAVGVVIA